MSCLSSRKPVLEDCGRPKLGAPIRQALLSVKLIMIQSTRTSHKLSNLFVMLCADGLYFYDSINPEAVDKVKAYVILNEPEWNVTNILDHNKKKFILVIQTSVSKCEIHFRDFSELDIWSKCITNGYTNHQSSNTSENNSTTLNSGNGDETVILATNNDNDSLLHNITSSTRVSILSITVPSQSELPNDPDLCKVEDLEFCCKLVMGNTVFQTITVSVLSPEMNKAKSNKRSTCFNLAVNEKDTNHSFVFQKATTPNVLNIILYQRKRRSDNSGRWAVRGVLNLDIDCARASGDVKDAFTPRPSCIFDPSEKSMSISVVVRSRYDEESLGRVTFGAPLKSVMERMDTNDGHKLMVPDVMYQCLAYLWKHSLKTQGIFRVSGNKNRMKGYVSELDQSPSGTLPLKKFEDENTVAGIMKLYLRELPEPLINYDKYEEMLIAGGAAADILAPKDNSNPMNALIAIKQFASSAATKDMEKPPLESTLERLRNLTQELPEAHYLLLKYTCHLLHCITHHSDVNFMKPTNLAIVFGPVFGSPSPDLDISKQEMLTGHLPYLSRSTEIMIVNWEQVFPNSNGMVELIECNNNITMFQKHQAQKSSDLQLQAQKSSDLQNVDSLVNE